MFIVFLKFAENKSQAKTFMDGHNTWLKQGFEDGVFLMSGSLQPQQGGAVLAHGVSREDLQQRLEADPFVAEGVVRADIHEISPGKTNDSLSFLLSA